LNDADLGLLIGCQPKEVHKLTGKLREHRFLAVHTRSELREGQQRPINRIWYYIDYRATIDAIKWRVYLIDKQVQGNTVKEVDRKEYFCKRCNAAWTQMEVLDKFSPAGFLCHRCDYVLVHDPDHNRGGHEQSSKLNAQFKFITDLLPKIDEVVIPENNFEQALSVAVKVKRDETNPVAESVPVVNAANRPTAVSGMKQEGPTHINISFTTTEGPSEADIAADKARKAQIATQNALPVHFTHSTVTGEQVKFGPNVGGVVTSEVDDKKSVVDNSNADDDINGEDMKEYWARVKEEQEREAERERLEQEEEDTDDDEDEFEDVVPTASGSAVGTPSGTGGDNKLTSVPHGLASALRRGGSASASGTSTGATSPATGPGTPDDGRPAKKVRIEEPEMAVKEEEESEEEEFEDV